MKSANIFVLIVNLLLMIIGIVASSQLSLAYAFPKGAYKVGYTIHDFEYTPVTGHTPEFDMAGVEGSTRYVTLAIWYPSTDEEQIYDYNGRPGDLTGKVALNGRLDKRAAPYPLFVFSHGGSGCGNQSVYMAEYLASYGYIFAAPDHLDTATCSIKGGNVPTRLVTDPATGNLVPEIALLWLSVWLSPGLNPYNDFPSRPQDIKATISEILRLNGKAGSEFYRAVDENAIAVSGHSVGTWTTQAVSGVVPEGYEYMVDERVTACLFFAANSYWGTEIVGEDSYKKMGKPVMYMTGEEDQISYTGLVNGLEIPRKIAYDNSLPPKFFPIVKGVKHYDFSDWPICTQFGTVDECLQYSMRIRTILKYSLAFLDRYLKNDLSAEKVLTTSDPMLLEPYEYDLGEIIEYPPWDVNKDGVVDILDLVIVALNYGKEITAPSDPNPDVNGDGFVTLSDLILVGRHFGEIHSD